MDYQERKIVLILYYTLIYPNLIYKITVWVRASASRLSRLNVCLKKIVKTICHTNRRASASPLIISLRLLSLRHIYKYSVGNCVYKLLRHDNLFSTITYRNVNYNNIESDQRYMEVP